MKTKNQVSYRNIPKCRSIKMEVKGVSVKTRAFIKSAAFLALFTSLFSCGQKQNAKTLHVTSSFALGSTGYSGGLVVVATNSSGQSITANALGGTSISFPMEDGTWTFHVAGWDGAAPFQGNARCGYLTTNLDSSTTSLSISANEANCSSAEFTNGLSGLADSVSGFRQIKIHTCEALYYFDAASYFPIVNTTPESQFSTGFCTQAEVPKEYTKFAGSVKFIVDGNLNTGLTFPTIASSCISTATASFLTGVRFPANKIPVKVQLFKDGSCSDLEAEYKFTKGLLTGDSGFDSVVNNQNTSGTYNLFLPFSDIKRGYSALMNKLPTLKCGGSDCLPMPSVGSLPADYFLYDNGEHQKVRIPEAKSCSEIVAISTGDLNIPAAPGHCSDDEDEDNNVFLYIKPVSNTSCNSVPCSLTFTVNGTSITRTFSANQSHSTERNTYDSLWRLLGTSSNPNYFYDFFEYDDDDNGLVGHIREELGPTGPLSLFGNTTCASLSGTKSITLWEDGEYKSFQVSAEASTLSIPRLLCDNTSSLPSSCTANPTFDKKIVMRELVNQVWTAKEVIHVDCDNQIGFVEIQRVENESSGKRTEKRFIGWNTSLASAARVESLDYEKELNSSNMITQERTNFERAEVSGANFKGQILGWDSYFNSSTASFNEYLSHRDFYSDSGILISHQKNVYKQSTASREVFTLSFMDQFFNVPFLARNSYQVKSPDGSKMVRVWTEYVSTMNKIYLSLYSGGMWGTPILVNGPSSDVLSTKVAVNNVGDVIIAWTESVSGTIKLKVNTRLANGTWKTAQTISAGVTSENVGDYDVCTHATTAAVVWDQLSNSVARNVINVAYSTGPFTTWNKPIDPYADAISDSAYISVKPKCAVYDGAPSKIVITYKKGTNIEVTENDLTTYSAIISGLIANTLPANPSASPDEPFLQRHDTGAYISYYDNGEMKVYKSTFTLAGSSWIFPAANTGTDANFYNEDVFTKTISSGFGVTGPVYTAPPSTLTVPSHATLKGTNFNLLELHPSSVEAKFTSFSTFIAQ